MSILRSDEVADSVKSQYISAPTLLQDGHCSVCDKDVDCGTHAIQCRSCKNFFHAAGCQNDSLTVSSITGFKNHILPAINKTGGYSKRFGCFYCMCDFCATEYEVKEASTTNDKVIILDKKIDNLKSDFSSELSEIQNAILNLKETSRESSEIQQINVCSSI